ncbi:MAG TPA: PhzF family phenazine biosynthesis protein [Fimbriiglobus sp.]|nr:PhzF family phenazine biosynthesis protein [Fimbriiglobus sp.]
MPPLFIVDAFTDRPFAGNPAAVCLLADRWPDDRWMQSVAAEMNLAETAFTWRRDDGDFPLRWMTPRVEVALCGHATLATAHVLWQAGIADADEVIRFDTRSGTLTATRRDGEIELDFPAKPAEPADPPPGLLEAVGVAPRYVGRNQFDYLLEVGSASELRTLRPDFRRLAAADCRGVIATAPSDDKNFDFFSRFFAPAVGIDEDPVTGSAHCCLAAYWAGKLGKTELVGYQASARGGVVRVAVLGDRVKLIGRAVTVVRGELLP